MKTVHVAAGIIQRGDGSDEVLAVQRGYGDMAGMWEFPGGKVERGETAAEACERELAEELQVHVEDLRACYTVEYDYPEFHLSMECFFCRIAEGEGEPVQHDRQQDMRWVKRSELAELDWMPADVELVRTLASDNADNGETATQETELVRRRAAIRKSMQGNKRADTRPELLVRHRLREAGLTGYRLQWKKAPGRPDIAFPGRKVAIFVNGCYWHRCPHCHPSVPKRNTAFWEEKFRRNVARDQQAITDLEALGWTAITIWECELKRDKIDATMGRVVEQIHAAGTR